MLALEPDEAENLAKCTANVTRHYNMPVMAQETADWIKLIMCGSTIIGSRVMAASVAREASKPAPSPQQNRPAPEPPPAPNNVPHGTRPGDMTARNTMEPGGTAPKGPSPGPTVLNRPGLPPVKLDVKQ